MCLLKKLICAFLLIFFAQSTFSQSNNNESRYYTAYDSVIGLESSALYNGKRYIDRYRSTENNHRFYEDFNFVKSSLVYDNQPFYNIPIKYDLYAGVLVVKLKGDNAFFNLELITENVSEFWLSNTHFVNLSSVNSNEYQGFAKILYSGNNVLLYSKLHKSIRELLNKKSITYQFNDDNTFLIQLNTQLKEIDSKKSLKKLMPLQAKFIDTFYSENKVLLKSNQELFLTRLITSLDKNLKNQVQE